MRNKIFSGKICRRISAHKMESWDRFVVIFFVIIGAYSFIVGKSQTLKIILSSYISLLAADGFGNLISKFLIEKSPLLKLAASSYEGFLVVLKISIFVVLTVFLSTRKIFAIKFPAKISRILSFFLTGIFGILSAGLIVSTLLVFVSGFSLVDTMRSTENPVAAIAESSRFVKLMVQNYSLWFSLPILTFVATSFLENFDE